MNWLFVIRGNGLCHTLTGVWVEIIMCGTDLQFKDVTPSRVCELKSLLHKLKITLSASHPHGCVSWNILATSNIHLCYVTPSRVCELKLFCLLMAYIRYFVTPSRVCELKFHFGIKNAPGPLSHPHGCVSWNDRITKKSEQGSWSHPHGCVSWNLNWLVDKLPTLNVTPSRVCELKL